MNTILLQEHNEAYEATLDASAAAKTSRCQHLVTPGHSIQHPPKLQATVWQPEGENCNLLLRYVLIVVTNLASLAKINLAGYAKLISNHKLVLC